MPKRPTMQSYLTGKLINRGRRAIGLRPQQVHTWENLIEHYALSAWEWLVSQFIPTPAQPRLPDDLPRGLFNALDTTLRNRGGTVDDAPNFWLPVQAALSTPFFWSLQVDYASTADPSKLASFEMALEDSITRAGYDYNIRIQRRPLRIEIDKPKPPAIKLADLWPLVAEHAEVNTRAACVGLAYKNGDTIELMVTLEGEDFSAFIAGSPGSGKTQLSMSIMLTLALTNSPESLSMVIIDPKAVDWRPFNSLSHLALPVVNEALQAAQVVQSLCDEMDKRTAQAARGDKSFFAHSILLYVDELADLLMSLPADQSEQLAKNFQRLCQKGRGVGFIIVGATQRVYDLPANVYSKLNCRFVGKTRTANDSVAISGVPGTTTNRLPGRGSFELYSSDQTGLRIQAPFVADSKDKDYDQQLAPFFNDIRARWLGRGPGWTTGEPRPGPEPENGSQPRSEHWEDDLGTDMDSFLQQMNERIDADPNAKCPVDIEGLEQELTYQYKLDPSKFKLATVEFAYLKLTGKRPSDGRKKRIFEWFINYIAPRITE
ncbi:MAG: FtsK/SpoIIIE domain-containing protein [Caldilineaceae bacterium]